MPDGPSLNNLSGNNISGVLQHAAGQLAAALALPPREARLEARVLLQHCTGQTHAWLIAHGNEMLTADQQAHFESLARRRLQGEPIAYIVGQREFYGLPFTVSTDTLIPRPDTELLVELALRHLPSGPCSLLDLGTGSGAIAVSLAHLRPDARVTATDQSVAALHVAQRNAERHAAGRIHCVAGSWYAPLGAQRFDLIASNPPYIAAHDPHLQQGDLRFEPPSALASAEHGLADLRQIILQAPAHLNAQGWLLVEHGYDQQVACQELFRQAGFGRIETQQDLGGQPRVTLGQLT